MLYSVAVCQLKTERFQLTDPTTDTTVIPAPGKVYFNFALFLHRFVFELGARARQTDRETDQDGRARRVLRPRVKAYNTDWLTTTGSEWQICCGGTVVQRSANFTIDPASISP